MAKPKGGARPGAGRPKDRKNNKTLEFEAFCREALEKAKPAEGQLTSLEFFRAVYRDDRLPYSIRSHAADKALPYEHPRLQAMEHSGPKGQAIPMRLDGLNDTQLNTLLERIEVALGSRGPAG